MDQLQELQQQYKEYRQSLYKDCPQVEVFEKKKRGWFMFLMAFSLALQCTKVLVLWQMARPPIVILLLGGILGLGMNLIFLAASMGTKWRMAFILYLWFFYNAYQIATAFLKQGVNSWEAFVEAYVDGFFQYPLAVSSDVLSWIFILLLLPTAMWLTLVPANRKMAEQSDQIYNQMKQYMASHPIK
ncbi:MAG: hypothetical protein HFG61_12260 [Lachnospiraceae bacterium]|nr:hypothetical protein [Lachnospiraceae bacterium]